GVLAISIVGPEPVRQVLEVGYVGKAAALALVPPGLPVDLLQKHDVGVLFLQQLPHPGQHETLVPGVEALVDVVGDYLDVGHGGTDGEPGGSLTLGETGGHSTATVAWIQTRRCRMHGTVYTYRNSPETAITLT